MAIQAQETPVAQCVIEMRDVQRVYRMGDQTVRALAGLSLEVRAGEFTAIMGASGSGKSTLLNLLGCLDTPTTGRYRLRGQYVDSLDDDALADSQHQSTCALDTLDDNADVVVVVVVDVVVVARTIIVVVVVVVEEQMSPRRRDGAQQRSAIDPRVVELRRRR